MQSNSHHHTHRWYKSTATTQPAQRKSFTFLRDTRECAHYKSECCIYLYIYIQFVILSTYTQRYKSFTPDDKCVRAYLYIIAGSNNRESIDRLAHKPSYLSECALAVCICVFNCFFANVIFDCSERISIRVFGMGIVPNYSHFEQSLG